MTTQTRITWRDLLAVPFATSDCWDLAREVARRAGLLVPELPMKEHEDPRGVLTPVLQYIGPTASSAQRVGDLIVGDPTKLGWPSHVAALVDERERVAISTSKAHGPFAWPAMRHPCDYGVWRPKLALDGAKYEELEQQFAYEGRRAR